MTWHVQYRKKTTDRLERYSSPEVAIEVACRLIDGGCDVYGIGTGPLADSITKAQIARIYAIWARTRPVIDQMKTISVDTAISVQA